MIIVRAYYLLYVSIIRTEMTNRHLKIITKLAAILLILVLWYFAVAPHTSLISIYFVTVWGGTVMYKIITKYTPVSNVGACLYPLSRMWTVMLFTMMNSV